MGWPPPIQLAGGEGWAHQRYQTQEKKMKHQRLFMVLAAFALFGYVSFIPSAGIAGGDGGSGSGSGSGSGPGVICHNIGGPDAKGGGANCDPNTDDPCCAEGDGFALCIDNTQYFGIIINNSDK